jgi:hypothetical protein
MERHRNFVIRNNLRTGELRGRPTEESFLVAPGRRW